MRKILFLLALIPLFSFGQWDQYYKVQNNYEKFRNPIGKDKIVLCVADSAMYIMMETRAINDSLWTAIRKGKARRVSAYWVADSAAWYASGGAAKQRNAGDSVVLNRKLTAKGSDLWIFSRSSATPTTSNAEVYLSGSTGTAYFKAMKNNPPFSNSYAQFTLAPSAAAVGWAFSTTEFGSFAYQLDEYGIYPTDYTTAGTYNQYVGTPSSPWNAVISKRNQSVTTDTTGYGSTGNVGSIMYYNGHFYGLVAGTPPTWKQLDQ